MATELNRLIAMGGTQNRSPVQRYMETRAQAGQEKQNRLAMESTRQNMAIQRQQMELKRQTQQAEKKKVWGTRMAPVMREVSLKPENERQAYWEKITPDVMQMANDSGMPINEADLRLWNQQKANTIMDMNPVKAPDRLSRLEGPETVYEDWDPRLGILKEKSRGIRSQATGEYSSFKFPKGKEAALKAGQAESYARVKNQLRQYDTVEKLISDPQFIGGTLGKTVSLINSAVQQYTQASGQPAVIRDGRVNLRRVDQDSTLFQRLRKSAGVTDKAEAATIQLAYLLAKGNDQGGRVTDKDYQSAVEMMGGTADVKTRLELLDYRRDEAIESYNAQEEAYSSRFKKAWGEPTYYKKYKRKETETPVEFDLKTATDKEKDAEIKKLMQGIISAE